MVGWGEFEEKLGLAYKATTYHSALIVNGVNCLRKGIVQDAHMVLTLFCYSVEPFSPYFTPISRPF